MKLGRDAVPALNKIKTVNNQEILSKFQPEIPDLTLQNEEQLRKIIKDLCIENTKLVEEKDYYYKKSDQLQNKILLLQSMYIDDFKKELDAPTFMIAV